MISRTPAAPASIGGTRLPAHFQCPACGGTLVAPATDAQCSGCAARYQHIDGIVDFVGGRFHTQLDPHRYDADHGISDTRSAGDYRDIRDLLGARWPASLGSMVEIGCGTGAFTRALLATNDVRDAVLTDVSVDMLRLCKAHLQRLGLASRVPLSLATYSSSERCFRDATFDSCVGIQVLHHIPDYAAFLRDLFRFLKPGGVAFFAEPALRFHRALASALADFLAEGIATDATLTRDRQLLHSWIAVQRRGVLHQGDWEFLASLEDKHLFVPEEFAAIARQIGFADVEAFPLAPDPTGMRMASGLFFELGLSAEGTAEVTQALPSHAERYLRALPPGDRSASYLFWLRKPVASRPRRTRRRSGTPPAIARETVDLWPARWGLGLRAEPDACGLALRIVGWCLLKSDVRWLRIRLAGVQRDTPVWYPRTTMQAALNRDATYPAWSALCCGIDDRLVFDGVPADAPELPISVQLVLTSGFVLDLPVRSFRPREPLLIHYQHLD